MAVLSNDKRWLVTLVTSNKIVAPALREIIQNGMEELYTTLDDRLPKSYSLKTLTYEDVRHLAVNLSPSLKDLHFKNINNNSDVKGENKKTRYNYNVNSSVDLAKLYLPDYLAEFSAFDKSMDLSASLRLLGCRKYPIQIFVSSDPSHNIHELADDVKKNVRDPGAHFKENDWTPIFFDQCFDKLKALLQCLPLLPDEKKKELSDQLSTWKTEGFKLIVDDDIQELLEEFLKVEFASIHEKLDDMPTKEEIGRGIKTLLNIRTEILDGFGRMEHLLQTLVDRSSVLYTDATSNETHQMREKVELVRGHPARCDKTLKVTLLASEWNSSREGLSTINRHLAILMAKRSEVEVTLLVPQSACSEEEKKAAKSDKIVIREAKIRQGVDRLDCLSLPPEDLKIDVVVGHGAKLGKQAKIIRASHSCQWVQVVHTVPEEEKIARGKEKTTAELDLCKLANLVVAVGPKLTEAYGKQQHIITLTPGTFKEFSTINHALVDSENFKVLTFGRGDPEDCGLKGYDIAAKAVVELREQSYHLIVVSALDDNQEAVKERLLQSGISNLQWKIFNFSLQRKEEWKDCFRLADLFIMPYQTEGFGLAALRALSAGLPFLVSGNSGFGDALRTVPFGTHFVVDSEDPKVWAEAIDGVRKKKRSLCLKEIEQLRTSYEKQFSWEKQCDLLVDRMWEEVHGAGLLKQSLRRILSRLVINNNTLTEELTTSVSDMGFRISYNIGSRNCMFHALSEQLETVRGIQIQHGQLRQSLVQYLRKNPKMPDGTDLRHFVDSHEKWADYLTYMQQDGAWGDHLILWAAANCFKTCIHVVSNRNNDVVIRPRGPFDESEPLVLGYVQEEYYISIQPIQGLLERTLHNLQQMQLCVSTATSTEELTTIASDKGFRISDNQGSGNCMFHALSEQLETVKGIKIQHEQLRRSLVQYLRENSELPDGTDLRHFVHGHHTWADYLTYMEQDGAWGDHLILCAAANCFKTCIHVVISLQNDVVIRPPCPVDESKPLVLGYIHKVHYVSLQPIQS